MIIDTSALVAILAGEIDASRFAQAIECDPTPRIGTPALLEASIVLTRWYGDAALAALDAFTREAGAEVIAFDLPQLRAAEAAYLRFGKGRHPAGLNFGKCMSYALAQASGFIVQRAQTPCLRAPDAHHVVGDAHAGPVEVAVIAQTRAGLQQLGEQRALRGRRHALGAGQRGATDTQSIGGDGEQIGVLAHEDGLAGHRPAWRRAQQAA